MSTIKLILVDDHRIIINGIRSMLDNIQDFEIIGEATNGLEAVELVKANPLCDVVLMDIKMPVMNGIDATKEIRSINPMIKVMALTMFDENEYITNILQAGASGYILKNTGKNDLITAIRKVAQGETYFSKEVMAAVMSRFVAHAADAATNSMQVVQNSAPTKRNEFFSPSKLSTREIEILRLIASEMTNQEIAEKLFISPRTVHSHRRNLMQKIGVKNTAGLVRYALQHGLLETLQRKDQ